VAKAVAFVGGLACGFLLATGILISHADDVQAEVNEAAVLAHVDPVQLQGAVNSLKTAGVPDTDPFSYLRSTGELPPIALSQSYTGRVACIIRVESQGDPNAHNRSGASGLGQFLPSTWATTPQGRAGVSVYNAAANRAAIQWMLDNGRAREFDAVRFYGC
jgi:hypothetical protein